MLVLVTLCDTLDTTPLLLLLQQALQAPNLPLATWTTSLLLATGCGSCCATTVTATASSTTVATVAVAAVEPQTIAGKLLLAWRQGLYSPNMSLKLLAASVISSVLQELAFGGGPRGVSPARNLQKTERCLAKLPLLRLSALVVARIWKERAALPICSRYLQGLVELAATLSAVDEAVSGSSASSSSGTGSCSSAVPRLLQAQQQQGDSSMPRPLPAQRGTATATAAAAATASATSAAVAASCSREWDEAFVLSDAGWTVWSGLVTVAPTRWQHPPHTAALLSSGLGPDGGASEGTGDAPPLLLPGCKVIRGPDWTTGLYPEPRSSSTAATTSGGTTASGAAAAASADSSVTRTAAAAPVEQSDAPVAAPTTTTAPASPDLDSGAHTTASTDTTAPPPPAAAAATAEVPAEDSSRDSRTEQAGSLLSSLSSSSSSLEEDTGSSTVQAATPTAATAAAASVAPQQQAVHSKYLHCLTLY
jgi:hypothetical protein